jgi:tetratricopeptide (TPR) repeat protein
MNGGTMNSVTDRRIEKTDAEIVDKAIQLLHENELDAAIKILREVVLNTPNEYSNEYDIEDVRYIKFWDKNQFVHYVTWKRQFDVIGEINWVPNAYPRAHYYLGYILIHKKQFEAALPYLSAGNLLEPTNPAIIFELANAHLALGNSAQAIDLFNNINKESEHVSGKDYARSLRGKGIALIDQGKLDEAEGALLESLKGDPGNQLASNELVYISQLRKGRIPQATGKTITSKSAVVECNYCRTIQNLSIVEVNGEAVYICSKCKDSQIYQSQSVKKTKSKRGWFRRGSDTD